ncbi:hypothetical protein PQX77_022408 [Marasmius sp. AFHP31]|nr:hypothetical protein PQX77_022408 [Marasmius sp. AFHP31]
MWNNAAMLHRLDLQLHRAANKPLDIIVRTADPGSPSVRPFLLALSAVSPKWRHLYIEIQPELFTPWMTSIRGRLQSLKSLHIINIGLPALEFSGFEIAPKLKTLVVGPQRFSFNRFELPLNQITQLCWMSGALDYQPMFEVGLFLRRPMDANIIRSARFGIHPEWTARYQTRQYIPHAFVSENSTATFNHLTELEIWVTKSGNPSGIHHILSHIRLPFPTLKKLTISPSGPNRTALSEFLLARSHQQPLKYISIPRVEMPPNEFSALLSSLTLLETLSFGVAGGMSNDFLAFFYPNRQGIIVANLRHLSLRPVAGADSTYHDQILLAVLESRWKGEAINLRTRRVELSWPPQLISVDLDREDLNRVSLGSRERLDQLRAEGLKVEFRGKW